MTLTRLATVFVVLSLLGFGGGNAIIPQMHADVVDANHWITSAEFTRFFALGKLAPGPTTTMAGLVGYAGLGIPGAIVATLAVFLPSSFVVFSAGRIWDRYSEHPFAVRISAAIKPVVLGLIWAGVVTLGRGAIEAPISLALALIATVVLLRTNWNQSLLVLIAGVVGAFALR